MTKPAKQSKTPKPKKQPAEPDLPGHDLLQRVYNGSAVGILAINADGIVVYVNAVALKNIGLNSGDILGRPFFDFFHDVTDQRDVRTKIEKMEEITDREFAIGKQPDRDQWVLVSSKIQQDDKGEVLTYLFIRDISALKKRERLFSYLNNA